MAADVRKLFRLWRVVLSLMIITTPLNARSKEKKKVSIDQIEKLTSKETTSVHGRPAIISIKELADFEILPAGRKRLIEVAIAVATDFPWLPYHYGGLILQWVVWIVLARCIMS